MASLSEGIRTLFLAQSSITTLTATGPHGAEAIYVGDAPQALTGTHAPRIEITELRTDPMLHLGSTAGMRRSDVDIDCRATNSPASNSVADAIENYFNDYTGTAGSVTIAAVMLQDRTYSIEPPDKSSEVKLYVTTLNYLIEFTP